VALGLVDALHLQAEGHVVEHAQMREKRVVLEHHRGAALGRGQRRDVLAASMIAPSVTVSCPAIMRRVEDLPQPDGPSRQT
jgi:hypothetical protein